MAEALSHQLAVIRTYDELHAAIRARAESLKVSREVLDERSGLQVGYSAKLLAPVPLKNFGATSLGPMLAVLGVALVLIEDTETLGKIALKMPKRDEKRAHASHAMLPVRRQQNRALFNSEASKVMNARRHLLLTPNQRRRIAKTAARARWGIPEPANTKNVSQALPNPQRMKKRGKQKKNRPVR